MGLGPIIIVGILIIVVIIILIMLIIKSVGIMKQQSNLAATSDGYYKDEVGKYAYEYMAKVFKINDETIMKLIIQPRWGMDSFTDMNSNGWFTVDVKITNLVNGKCISEYYQSDVNTKYKAEFTIKLPDSMYDSEGRVKVNCVVESRWFVVGQISDSSANFEVCNYKG